MKILKHGNSVVFTCPDCDCVFSELDKIAYSSYGEDGSHYCATCPECNHICWAADKDKMANRYNQVKSDDN